MQLRNHTTQRCDVGKLRAGSSSSSVEQSATIASLGETGWRKRLISDVSSKVPTSRHTQLQQYEPALWTPKQEQEMEFNEAKRNKKFVRGGECRLVACRRDA